MSADKTQTATQAKITAEVSNNPEVNNPDIHQLGYEQAYKMLEQIVASMESGQLSLEDSLAAYQRGSILLEHCQKALASVEQQVKILNERQQLTTFKHGDE